MADAFVYCWTDWKLNKLYLGWHKGNQDDGYICSSKYMLEEYNLRSHDFTREIIASGTVADMVKFEALLLKKFDAAKSDSFYNKSNADGSFILDEQVKIKMSQAKLGKKRSIESCLKQGKSVSGSNNHFFGKTHTDDVRKKLSSSKKKSTVGSGNSQALKLEYNGQIFMTQDDLAKELCTSIYNIRKMRRTGEVKTLGYTNGR